MRKCTTNDTNTISVCPCQPLWTPLFSSRSIPEPGLSAQGSNFRARLSFGYIIIIIILGRAALKINIMQRVNYFHPRDLLRSKIINCNLANVAQHISRVYSLEI
jgi:hypothetical protein